MSCLWSSTLRTNRAASAVKSANSPAVTTCVEFSMSRSLCARSRTALFPHVPGQCDEENGHGRQHAAIFTGWGAGRIESLFGETQVLQCNFQAAPLAAILLQDVLLCPLQELLPCIAVLDVRDKGVPLVKDFRPELSKPAVELRGGLGRCANCVRRIPHQERNVGHQPCLQQPPTCLDSGPPPSAV